MILKGPFEIGSRLLPALKIGDGWVSLEPIGVIDNRLAFRWYVDIPAGEFHGDDLKSGVQGCTTQEMFGTMLAFLGAAAESYSYQQRTGREGENVSLFPPPVVEWAYQNSDEIDALCHEIGRAQTGELIEE